MARHAAQAALEYIHDDMVIGLGSGRTIEDLVEFISMSSYRNIKIVTNRMDTAILAKKRELDVIPSWMVDTVDVTFDELNYVVKDLSGMKNDTGVVLEDKLLASMADKFVEIVDKNEFAVVDAPAFPVLVETARPAFSFVGKKLEKAGAVNVAMLDENNQPFLAADGNYVIRASFRNNYDLKALDEQISSIPGVITTSIYTNSNAVALVYDKEDVATIQLD